MRPKLLIIALLLFTLIIPASAIDATDIPWVRVMGTTIDGQYINGAYSGGLNDSKPAFADIDNDGDLDLFIGELEGTITYYENMGTPVSPSWAAPIENYNSIDVGKFCAPTFADIDNDGDLDLFIGEMNGKITYYENTGTPASPSWAASVENYNSIDVGSLSAPAFADIDNDSDLDLFIGESQGNINYYENTGTAASPSWAAPVENYNSINVESNSAPSFADIDNDGDLDLFIGEGHGTIIYYENTGTTSSPSWAPPVENYNSINVGRRSTPAFADIDGDFDLDLFIGEYHGYINYYENTGTTSSPSWATPIVNYNSIDVGIYSAPVFADIDNDFDLDLFIGELDGNINYFENNGTPASPTWAAPVENYNSIDVGYYCAPTFADIDNDGDLDLFIGEWFGTITYYENTGTAASPSWATSEPFYNSIDVGGHSTPGFANIDNDSDLDLFIGEEYGTIIYYENTGTAASPSWAAPVVNYNSIDVGVYSGPAFADIDNDGDLDLFIGIGGPLSAEGNGTITYYENTGTPDSPSWAEPVANYNSIDVGLHSKPAFSDIDSDDDLDLFIGEYGGGINFYRNMSKSNLAISPRSATLETGEQLLLSATGTTQTVSWSIIQNNSSGTIVSSGATSATYTAGYIGGVTDKVQAISGQETAYADINVLEPPPPTTVTKAVIIAGGGKYPGNVIWKPTVNMANTAFEALRRRGFPPDDILYLSASPEIEQFADWDDINDIDGEATLQSLENAITNWSGNATHLFLYFVDHGGPGTFRINQSEILYAPDLDLWLDNLQSTSNTEIAILIESCFSGSFVSELTPPPGKTRIVITATDPDGLAIFDRPLGLESFSAHFIQYIRSGSTLAESFFSARNHISFLSNQNPLLDDDSSGNFNIDLDGAIAGTRYLGHAFAFGYDPPQIASVSSNQEIYGETSVTLWAKDVSFTIPLIEVTATIMPPGKGDSGTEPIYDLPKVTLEYTTSTKKYVGTYSNLTNSGTYKVLFSARDTEDNISRPALTYIVKHLDSDPAYAEPFTTGAADWTFVSYPESFTAAQSSYQSGAIALTATTNTDCFGFWRSPTDAVAITTGSLYQYQFILRSDVQDPEKVPTVRLRVNADTNQQADLLIAESANGAHFSPTSTPTTYTLFVKPPDSASAMRASFDLVNFIKEDSATGSFFLDSVTVRRFNTSDLTGETAKLSYSFTNDQEDWNSFAYAGIFNVPNFSYSEGSLKIHSTTNQDLFGFWQSPNFVIEADKLYRARFTISSDQVDPKLVPKFRLRMNTENAQASHVTPIESSGNAENSPTSESKTYEVYFYPPPSAVGQNMYIAFDMINFGGLDSPSATLNLESASIHTFNLP